MSFVSMVPGYDPRYLTHAVGPGAENYYLTAVAEHGEPPGYWSGRGAEELGFVARSQIDGRVMEALYSKFLDPRDPEFLNRDVPEEDKARLGRRPATFKTADEVLTRKLAAEPEATPERCEELRIQARSQARQAVIFHDATFSPVKSVTLLHAGLQAQAVAAARAGDVALAGRYRQAAAAVEDAIKAGAAASVQYLRDNAGDARTGYHGVDVEGRTTGRWMDAGGWVVANFFQHTNREGEPQLHIHQAILNRQLCADGKWRALDGRALYRVRPAAAAVGARVMEEQLTRTLGVEWRARPDGNGRELAGVDPETIAAFSSRRVQVTEDLQRRIEAYEAAHGRPPTARAVFKMAQDATKATKAGKRKAARVPSRAEELAAWEERTTRAEIQRLTAIPARVLGRIRPGERRAWQATDQEIQRVITAAVADAQAAKAVFSKYELMRYINRHLPDYLGGLPAERVEAILEDLTEAALDPTGPARVRLLNVPDVVTAPPQLRREDGRSVYEAPTAERYTTADQLDRETAVVVAAAQGGAPRVDPLLAATALGLASEHAAGSTEQPDEQTAAAGRTASEQGEQDSRGGGAGSEQAAPADVPAALAAELAGLHTDQAAAVYGIATSGRRVDVLLGPAGTGKSYTVARAATMWRHATGGRVVGLTTSQNAAYVLAGEGLDEAHNIARWLEDVSHGRAYVEPGQLLVVDEASMVTTDHLARIEELAAAAGAKILLTGDDQQLSAPGAGGVMRHLVEQTGAHRLDTVTRFEAEWEKQASLRLRQGVPEVLTDYDRHGRLLDGDREAMDAAAYQAYLADHLAGRQTLLLAPTNDKAAELAGRVRADLISYGLVEEAGVGLRDGNTAGRGDLIQVRQNDRTVRIGEQQRTLTNRDVLAVEQVNSDGSITTRLLDKNGQAGALIDLEPDYAAEHVELAYAGTVHAAQGRTVDTCHAIVNDQVTRQMLYVMLTRARDGNHAYVITERAREADLRPGPQQAAEHAARLRGAPAGAQREQDAPQADRYSVLAQAMQRDDADQTAIEAMRGEARRVTHLGHLGTMWTDVVRAHTTEAYVARAQARGLLDDALAERLRADGAAGTLGRLLRQLEMSGRDADRILAAAITDRELDSADSPAQVLHWRIIQAAAERGIDPATLEPAEAQIAASWRDRTPDLGDSALTAFADALADQMAVRTGELGRQAADEPPPWLTAELGAPPTTDDPAGRAAWAQRAGRVLAYREQYGHRDEADPIGPRPSAVNPEQWVAWMSAYDALGYPEDQRDIAGARLGELWVMRAAYEREARWAPPYVADELREATIAARERAADAVRLRAQAAGVTDPQTRTELEARAGAQEALAAALEAHRARLDEIDQARQAWHAATEGDRVMALRADAELRRRPEVDASLLPPLHAAPGEPRPDQAPTRTGDGKSAQQVAGQLTLDLAGVELERDTVDQLDLFDPQLEAERAAADEQPAAVERPPGWSWIEPRPFEVDPERAEATPQSIEDREPIAGQLTLDQEDREREQDGPALDPSLTDALETARHARRLVDQRAAAREAERGDAQDDEERRRRQARDRDAARRTPEAGRRARDRVEAEREHLEQRERTRERQHPAELAGRGFPVELEGVLQRSQARRAAHEAERQQEREAHQPKRHDDPGRGQDGPGRSL